MATRKKIELARKVFARDDFTCQYCGWVGDTFEKWRNLTVDHFKPRSVGGAYWDVENCVTSCWDCNQIKSGEVFPNLEEAQKKFKEQYLPIERHAFEEYFVPLIGDSHK